MKLKFSAFGAAVLGLTGLNGAACIQLLSIPAPHSSAQLPADLFKIHVHISPEPIAVEMQLLGGKVSTLAKNAEADPQEDFSRLIKQYEADPARHNTFAERNDYAGSLLFAGRYVDAIPVLIQLEKDYPGENSTAANLGTAYELVGDLENATRWIKMGMERNAEEHQRTEWLHLAILAAKQKLKTDPHWLASHSVLDGQTARGRSEVEQALEYQLNERLYFIRDNDVVMCDLFYEAAVVTLDPAKRGYYLRQVPRFGDIRQNQVRKLLQG